MSSSIELLYSLNTEVHFTSFLSGGFITAIERKLTKCTSMHCLNVDKKKDLAESTLPLNIGLLPYSCKQKQVLFSEMSRIVTPSNGGTK